MEPSLSLVLPVHNAQAELGHQLTLLLDILPDLTPRFDVLIIDDGSTDRTEEVAHDLSRRFPQVQVARHPSRSGAGAATATGLQRTRGDVVIVIDDERISPARLRQVWHSRQQPRLVGTA